MKTENRNVYRCEHCRKYGLSKSNMKKHEQFCFGNPENVPRCFDGCKHLSQGSGPNGGKHFYCSKLKKGLFTKKQIVLGRKIERFDAIEMPHECSDFEFLEPPLTEYDNDNLFDF